MSKSPRTRRRKSPTPKAVGPAPSAPEQQEPSAPASAATRPSSVTGLPKLPVPGTHPTPEKAYKSLDFLTSAAARQIRIQCELTEPAVRFKNNHIQNTVVLFGSARIPLPQEADDSLNQVQTSIASGKAMSREQKAKLDQARRLKRASPYYQQAMELSYEITKWSLQTIRNPRNRFYICSGGGPGIMEAANRGAHEAGGQSVALGISLPFEQHLNPFTSPDLAFEFHYFFVRKYWFFYLAKALVVFPGGFGTMDELFEMLTLIQTHKATKYVPIVLYGRKFWEEVVNFRALVEWGVISESDLDLFKVFDDVPSARDYLIDELSRYYLA